MGFDCKCFESFLVQSHDCPLDPIPTIATCIRDDNDNAVNHNNDDVNYNDDDDFDGNGNHFYLNDFHYFHLVAVPPRLSPYQPAFTVMMMMTMIVMMTIIVVMIVMMMTVIAANDEWCSL